MRGVPPKRRVSQVIGFIKGKSAMHLARVYGENSRNFAGHDLVERSDMAIYDRGNWRLL